MICLLDIFSILINQYVWSLFSKQFFFFFFGCTASTKQCGPPGRLAQYEIPCLCSKSLCSNRGGDSTLRTFFCNAYKGVPKITRIVKGLSALRSVSLLNRI